MRATDTTEVGRTGLRVTRLGLGGVALSGAPPATDPERATAEKEAVALIQRSLALGVNYLDTAPMYGVGESEARYGEALRGVPRERYVLSTKVGRVLRPPAPGAAQATWAFDFSASGVRESFTASLGRLGLERVDIVFVHDPDAHYEQALKGPSPFCSSFALPAGPGNRRRDEPVADGAGVRPGGPVRLLSARRTLHAPGPDGALRVPALLRRPRDRVVAGGPYNSGILAVGARAGATFNYRAASPEMMEKAARIGKVCARHDVPLKAAALQFILAHPAIVSVIPGARSIQEVEDNVRMVELPIPGAFWAELKSSGLIAEAAPTPSS